MRTASALLVPAALTLFACSSTPIESAAPVQPLPRDVKTWVVEYVVVGGIAGITHHLTITSDGNLTLVDQYAAEHVDGRASDAVVDRIAAFLEGAHAEKPSAPTGPDQPSVGLMLKTGGHDYPVEITPAIEAVLKDASDAAVKAAIVGVWWQSMWKLCKPAEQFSAADADPVDTLELDAQGGFSLTWVGGGARTTGVPHVSVPDYRGRYTINPDYGSIDFRIENASALARDFSGRGNVRINTNEKTLQLFNVWFGTRTATQKPDICELTFKRRT